MTYAAEKAKFSRRPIEIVEIVLNACSLTYGTSPCTATGSAGAECYNTFKTCQDQENYADTTTTYRFIKPSSDIPAGFDAFPCVADIDYAATRIVPNSLGQRANVSIRLGDFPHHDRGIDPYVANRSYTPEDQGTFFGKFLTRNRYFFNREIRIYEGFLDDSGAIDLVNNFQKRRYFVERVDGPVNGVYTFVAKDVIKLTDKQLAPAPTQAELLYDISSAETTSATLTGEYSDIPTGGGVVSIGDEIITYASRSSAVISTLTRAEYNTEASDHSAGDAVQIALVYDSQKPSDVLEDLITSYTDISASFIPSADWETEIDTFLGSGVVTSVVAEPTQVKDLIEGLLESINGFLWWDIVDQEIKFKLSIPVGAVDSSGTLTDDANLLKDTVTVREEEELRLTRVSVNYNRENPLEDDKFSNYSNGLFFISASRESDTEFGTKKEKTINSNWLTSSGQALQLASRLINLFEVPPKIVRFEMDAKEDYETGQVVKIDTRHIQGDDGANDPQYFLLTSKKPIEIGARYAYEAMQLGREIKPAYIGPNTLNDYSSESDANKEIYAFISDDNGILPDTTEAYKII